MNGHPSCAGIAASVLAAAVGCGGGGGASGSGSTAPLAPKPEPLTHAERQHFLLRTSFGAPRAELAELQRVGLGSYVDHMLAFDHDADLERAAEREMAKPSHPSRDGLARWWLHLMVRTKNPFRERLALFWHDHFATSGASMSNGQRWWMREHVDLLRRHGAGNLRELLRSLAVDQAMLFWLDGYKSTKDRPNENFARELWELFSLGVDNGYTQRDIEEAARAFTGWELRLDQEKGRWFMRWNAGRHDATDKTVFGRTGNWGYTGIVDLTLDHRPVAEYVCRRLYEHFCHDGAPDDVVAELAKLLRDGGWELKPVLRVLLRSNAFFSARSRAPRVKGPMDYVVGFVRTTRLEAPLATLDRALTALGQRPTEPPGVDGWPSGTEWLAAAAMLQRSNTINDIVTARDHHSTLRVDVRDLVPEGSRSAAGVADVLADLLAVRLTAGERAAYELFLNSRARWPGGELVLEPSPFDWNQSRHIDERVRNLLHALAQHPSYQTH